MRASSAGVENRSPIDVLGAGLACRFVLLALYLPQLSKPLLRVLALGREFAHLPIGLRRILKLPQRL